MKPSVLIGIAKVRESYCRLAGSAELADRVRPSDSRLGRTRMAPDEVSDSAVEGRPLRTSREIWGRLARRTSGGRRRRHSSPAVRLLEDVPRSTL